MSQIIASAYGTWNILAMVQFHQSTLSPFMVWTVEKEAKYSYISSQFKLFAYFLH